METIKTRNIWVTPKTNKEPVQEKLHITIPAQKISKYRNEVEELDCCLLRVEKGTKIALFDSISF